MKQIEQLRTVFNEIFFFLDKWEYGQLQMPDGTKLSCLPARRLKIDKNKVQIKLWEAGQHGHKRDYWHDVGYGKEKYFTINKRA